MTKKIFKSNFEMKSLNLNHRILRVALIGLFISLGVGEMWGTNSYYSRFTAKSGNTAQGLVYAAGSESEGSINDYTNQVTPDAHDGSSGAEYTWHAWAKAARGYRFKTWTKGSNITSNGTLTEPHCTFDVKHATSDGGYVDGDATATFESATAYTLTFKQPQNFGGYTAAYANYTIESNKFKDYTKTITMTSSTSDKTETSYASDKVTLTATARAGNFLGWYVNGSQVSTNTEYTFNPSATCNVEGRWEEVRTNIPMHFKAVEKDDNDNYVGSYTVGGQTVQATDYNTTTGSNYYLETTLTATPAEGYVFTGWYTKEGKKKNFVSYDNPYNAYFDQETTLYANFTYSNYSDDQKAQFKVGGTYYLNLNEANTAAGSNGTIVCTRDGILPPGNYTISKGVKLYIPWSTSESYQTKPEEVTTAETLSAYRTLTFAEGANVVCNGIICVGGKIMAAGGGSKSAYVTGPCGVINMANGGHIELNSGAILYCWGFIKGQDMDQGNNTLDIGTITANSGSVIWENFEVGDWRGGTATSAINNKKSSWKLFPFQSYSIQNIEVPTTYKYGSTLSNYVDINSSYGTEDADFNIIGSTGTLFLLKDPQSIVRKWYDPTTDLTCYELSGTAQLDALNIYVYISVSSADFYLPISNSMHIILTNCNMTLSKPMTMQAGSVIEIKEDATANLEARLHMFDKDDWGLYIHNYFFRSFNNLTSHKDRGAENSNAGLEDAKLIVDGTLNVVSGKGYIYSTVGGANIMGNNGGKIIFGGALPGSETLHHVTVSSNKSDSYIYDAPVSINTANLCNEDGSYTKSIASTAFHNVNGRWFAASAKDEKADHTYDFTYISSGEVSGTGGTSSTTDAVYSWDKTGLELRQKWFNVTYSCEGTDENDNTHYWWHGQGEQSTWFYNWTLNSDWHQFMPTATEGMYSGSNNKIYTKTDCSWEELGETDVNCLYTIGGIKKALVDGQFIALEPNNNDPAFHLASDVTKYYICFSGCNWHEATKYEGENKAYIVDGGNYIWFEGAWLNVERQEPFFYTVDETNVKTCYEYLNGDWVVAEPYVKVVDALETRRFYFLNEAITVASGKKNPTITILRDIDQVSTPFSYTGTSTTCTLDLNGKKAKITVEGKGDDKNNIPKMFTINGASSTFTITDNSEGAKGELKLVASTTTATNTQRWSGVYVANGSLIMQKGNLSIDHPFTWVSNSNSGFINGILVASGKTFTQNGGAIEIESDYNTIGINGASGTPTININGGRLETVARTKDSPYAIYAYGTINVKGGYVRAYAKASTSSRGVNILASTSYQGTLNVTGGTIEAYSKNTSYGVFVNWTYATSKNEPNTITTPYYAKANISGGEIKATTYNGSTVEAIRSYGTTTISGGTITAMPSSSTAFGIRIFSGTTTIKNSANINVLATSAAYGVRVSQETPADKTGGVYNGTLVVEGGSINVETTSTTEAYGIYVGCGSRAITTTNATNASYYAGNYANAGTATINGGTINVTAKSTSAYGIVVAAPVTQSGAEGYAAATATPKCTVNGGYFKTKGTGSVYPVNAKATADNFKVYGGYYSHNGNLATYAISPKQVVTLPETDANYDPYFYEVAEAYTITFMNGETQLQSDYQKVGTTPVYRGATPTKASTASESYEFDGWSTSDGGDKLASLPAVASPGATYYAHYNTTDLRYKVTLDATTNGGTCATDLIYVNPGAAVGTLPTATKTGYTFQGWYSVYAATGGTKLESTTTINADVTYYARFAVNSYALTWNLDGGKVTTAGKYGSTSWPAKNATGSPSTNVPYGSTLTAPVVARTGYTFKIWSPTVSATMPAEAVTYTAQWTANTNTAYTVKHYLLNIDGSRPTDPFETESLTGTTATSVTPAVKSYDGFISPATQTVTIGAAGTTEVEYLYTRQTYTISLDATTNGGTSDETSIEVIHGATIGTVPPDAQKGCNDFTGWFTKAVGGVKITSDFVIEYDMKTLYAQFSDDLRTYPITYLAGANGTGTVDAGTKTCGETATLSSSTFTRTGYTQKGWSESDGEAKAYDLGGAYTANAAIILYPFWAVNTHKFAWNFAGGSTSSTTHTPANNALAYGSAISYPANSTMTKQGYTFDSWSTSVTSMPDNDLTITASWNVVTYNLTYEGLEGASNSNPATYNIETPTITLADPGTRAGYTFTGWTCGGSPITQITLGSTGDKTITANWEQTGVTIHWKNGDEVIETDEGVLIGATPHFDGETPTKATDATNGYTFDGWDDGTNVYAADALPAVSGPVTYTAHYSTTPTVASVEVGSTTTYYTDFAEAWAATNSATGEVTLKLLQDVSGITTSLAYTNAQNCTFDLNNHLLKGAVNPKLLEINKAGCTFTITDSSAEQGGELYNEASGEVRYYGVYLTAGTLNLEAGTVHAQNLKSNYSSATTAAKRCMASGVYVTKSQTFNMNGGTVTGEAVYAAYGVEAAGVIVINNGTINATTTKFTSAGGIVCSGTTTINSGTINATAKTSTAYGIYVNGGTTTIKGGEIEAKTTTKNCYGLYVKSGALTIPSASIVEISATATTSGAYGVYVAASKTATIEAGTFTVKAGTSSAAGVNSLGTTTIKGGTFNVSAVSTTSTLTTVPCGIYATRGTVTVNDNPTFNVTSGAARAFGAFAYGTIGAKGTGKYSGTININGGTFNVTSTTTTAYGVYAGLYGLNIVQKTENAGDTIFGQHYMPGIISVTDGTFNVKAKTTKAYALVLSKEQNESGAVGTTLRSPKITVTGGKFKVESDGDANATAYAISSSNNASQATIQGGWYNVNANLSLYTAPEVSGNYHVLDLPSSELPYKYEVAESYTITFKNGESVLQSGLVKKGETPTYAGETPTKAEDEDYTYKYIGWDPEIVAATADATYTAQFSQVEKEVGTKLDIVEWTSNGNGKDSLTLNLNGIPAAGWPYTINNVEYYKDKATATAEGSTNYRAADRTLTIPYSGSADTKLTITVKDKDNNTYSRYKYIIPHVYGETAELAETNSPARVIVVNSGTLTVKGDVAVNAIYVGPGAELKVDENVTLTIDSLMLRTTPWEAAILDNQGTIISSKTYYTRKVADNSKYYQFAIPLSSNINNVRLSDGSKSTYNKSWILKSYEESFRAANGPINDVDHSNWKLLTTEVGEGKDNGVIAASKGYEIFSNTPYYREYYFPVTLPSSPTTLVGVSCTKPKEKTEQWYEANSGWNALCSPLMGKYSQTSHDPSERLKISQLNPDGTYQQTAPDIINPAVPFYYQAPDNGTISFNGDAMIFSAPRRAWNAYVPTQWLQLAIRNIKGDKLDETSIYAHPEKFAPEYETGYDVAKQSLTGGKALIYSELPCGKLAFAAVPDSLAENRIPITVNANEEGEYLFSLMENNYLGRLQHVLLHDTQNGLVIDLLERDYATEINAGTNAGRFYIQCVFAAEAPAVTTGVNSVESNDDAPQKIMYKNKVYIIYQGRVYDMTGRQCELK